MGKQSEHSKITQEKTLREEDENTSTAIESLIQNTLKATPQGQLLLKFHLPELENRPKPKRTGPKKKKEGENPQTQTDLALEENPPTQTGIPSEEESESLPKEELFNALTLQTGNPGEEIPPQEEIRVLLQTYQLDPEKDDLAEFPQGDEHSNSEKPKSKRPLIGKKSQKNPAEYFQGEQESFNAYCKRIRHIPSLSLEEELQLGKKYKEEQCEESRLKLILHNLKFVIHIAKDYKGMLRNFSAAMSFPDLVSEGNIGLMKAVERYEPKFGNKVSTYAHWWICQEIKLAIANTGKLIRVPNYLIQKLFKIQRIIASYQREHPTLEISNNCTEMPKDLQELLKNSGFKPEEVHILDTIPRLWRNPSLDEPISTQNQDVTTARHEMIEDEEAINPFAYSADQIDLGMINEIMQDLPERDQRVIIRRFGLDNEGPKTLEEVGEEENITRERVRQIQARALETIRLKIKERKAFSQFKKE